MNDQEENVDLLAIDDDSTGVDTLPEVAPFSAPRPSKPWLLIVFAVLIVILGSWIAVNRFGGDSGSSISVDLDTRSVSNTAEIQPVVEPEQKPIVVEEKNDVVQAPVKDVQSKPVDPVVVEETDGTPIRVVKDRQENTFDENKPVVKNMPKVVKTPAKSTVKPVRSTNGSFYVQFGSYSSRALAQSAEQKIRKAHQSLLSGRQFVILAAEVNGKTIYRLRISFHTSKEANGFCRNAKSDGLDCYVAK